MGRTVTNDYESGLNNEVTYLSIVSVGYYSIKITIDTIFDGMNIKEMLQKHRWCYERTKGQVYCMDLTGELPRRMGYHTPRAYLKDYIPYLLGYDRVSIDWRRPTIFDYCIRPCDLFPRAKTF